MEYIENPLYHNTDNMLKQIETGAFLTTKKNGKVNTMTIGWGGINVVWGRPVFVIYVRYNRETYNYLKDNEEFTISVPVSGTLKKELTYCGTKSARDTDKIKDCNFTLIPGRKTNTPVIGECDLHYECKIIYRQAMDANMIPDNVQSRYYKNNQFHMVYYGEIIDSYRTKGVQ